MQQEAKATKGPRPDQLANSVDMASARMCMGRSTIYELIGAGELRTIKIGAKTLIPESELIGLIQRKLSEAA